MRIHFLIHDDYAAGGLQRSTVAAANCLMAAGHEVEIICIKALEGGLAGHLSNVRPLTPEHHSKLGFWLTFLRALRRSTASERPDLCIGMGLATSILLVLATLGMQRPKLFGSERAYPPATPARPPWNWLRRFAFRRLDKVICQTGQTAAWYQRAMGIACDRLVVIPNVVEPPPAASPPAPAALEAWDGHPVIACVGRLEPQKGFDMALPIFSDISTERPDARFLIVGEGPCEAEYRGLGHRLGLGENLLILPRLPGLDGLWSRVSVFLLTSRFEGIPNVLAEAMAHGVPCVAFDCPTGPSELIRDGENGFLVPLGDVAAATRRCIELLDDPAFAERLGGKARAVASRYSPSAICKRWSDLIDTG